MNHKNPLIYIVEDDPAFSKLTEKTLRSCGYKNLKIYFSGNDCLKELEVQKPDIVIQDYEMPGINGLETMLKIKEKYPDTEFVFLSGQSSIKVAVEAMNRGAFDYIVKDEYSQENLIQKVKKIVYIHKLEFEKKMSVKGKRLFLALLLLSWGVMLLLYFLGILKEVVI